MRPTYTPSSLVVALIAALLSADKTIVSRRLRTVCIVRSMGRDGSGSGYHSLFCTYLVITHLHSALSFHVSCHRTLLLQ